MAKPARQSVTVHYRRLQDATGSFGQRTLQTALRHAMNHAIQGEKLSDHWKHRAWIVPPAAEETLLMNLHQDHRDYFFGDLTHYTKGFMQALLAQAQDVPMLPVEQQPAPRGKEYVHSMMYWLAVKDHLLMMQSKSLGAKHLEEYLTWLLKDQSSTISATGQVILQAKFDPSDVGGDLDDLSEIIVGGSIPIPTTVETKPSKADVSEKYRKVARKNVWSRGIEVLRAIMNNEADVQKLLKKVPPEADLQVSVSIGYKVPKSESEISRAPMKEALRNLPDGEIKARGRDGRMTGKDIRLSYPASVLKNGSLLDPDDAIRALREAYKHFVDNGKIDS